MKKIQVKITAEFEVPDEWEIVDYVQDKDDKIKVLKVGSEYCDFDMEFLMAHKEKRGTVWSNDESMYEKMIHRLHKINVDIKEHK